MDKEVRDRAFPELCSQVGSAVIPSRIPTTLEAEGIDLPLNIYKVYEWAVGEEMWASEMCWRFQEHPAFDDNILGKRNRNAILRFYLP